MSNGPIWASRNTATAQLSTQQAHIVGYSIIAGASAGTVEFFDTAAGPGGTSKLKIDTPASATAVVQLSFPHKGIWFNKGVYVVITNATFVTTLLEGGPGYGS